MYEGKPVVLTGATCDDPPEIITVLEYAERYANMKGIKMQWYPAGLNPNPIPAEEMIDRLINGAKRKGSRDEAAIASCRSH